MDKSESDALVRPVKVLALHVVSCALRDALAGKPVSVEGLRPWLMIADLPPERLPAVLERAKKAREE